MKKFYLINVFTFLCLLVNAANYYVNAVNGSNSNSGTSPGLAFLSIATAANLTNAGDTVFIMNGAYAAFNITRPGNASSPIVYTNYPGSTPQIISNSSTYNVITVSAGANYITINGLEIIGYGVNLSLAADTAAAQAAINCSVSPPTVNFIPKYNGSGINIGNSSAITHHVIITNNIVHDCAAVGIGIGYSDYITIDHNTVYNNSWYTPYGTSGISFGNSQNYDNNITTYRMIVSNNICYGNRLYVLWRGSCTISDGNGIILDIPLNGYNGKQLVVNNVCYNNGGSGIHDLNNNNVDFINNTVYLNAASPTNGGGSLYAYGSNNVNFFNNIIVARPGKPVNRSPNSTNVIYDNNIYYGGGVISYVGTHSLIQDPKFVNASTDPAIADFRLQSGSFAVNNGDNNNTTPSDRNKVSRPIAAVVDMGAYESSYSGNLNTYPITPATVQLAGGTGGGAGSAYFYGPYYSRPGIAYQQSRYAYIYPRNLLSNYNVPSSCSLTSLQFNRGTGNTQVAPANSTVRIYLRNETSDNFGTADFDWTTILPGAANPAVLVYGGDASLLFGNAAGWQKVNFQIPFNYTGAHLGVYVEYLQNGNISGGADIIWAYDNNGSNPFYDLTAYPNQAYAVKYVNSTGSATTIATTLNTLNTTSVRRPVIQLSYIPNSSLPISVQQFGAVKRGGNVYVNWLTGSEINNKGFEVQRSKDGNSFEPIGFVNPKAVNGNSSSLNYYDFTDVNPINGTGYYRLLQKNKDGKGIYSAIISIKNSNKEIDLVSLYPNPISDKLNAIVNIFGRSTTATISIQDINGRVISRFTKSLITGYNSIEINVAKQSGGTYMMIIEMPSGERLVNKFIKK